MRAGDGYDASGLEGLGGVALLWEPLG